MSRRTKVGHRFVETLPSELEPGLLYISGSHNIIAHLCCCGCGSEVVTPLGPAGWTLRYDGQVSLTPSVGNGALPCRSHYVIHGSQVRWLSNMTPNQHARAKARDQVAATELNPSRLAGPRGWLEELVRPWRPKRARRLLADGRRTQEPVSDDDQLTAKANVKTPIWRTK